MLAWKLPSQPARPWNTRAERTLVGQALAVLVAEAFDAEGRQWSLVIGR